MNRLRLVVAESLRSLGANLSTTLAATVTVLIAMFLLGLTISLGTMLISFGDHAKRQLLVKVYFNNDATPQQINSVRLKLDADPRVQSVKFVSKEDALVYMKKKYSDLFKTPLPGNPLPASYDVKPKRGEYVDAVFASLHPLPPGVNEVKEARKQAHAVLSFAHALEYSFIVGVALLVLAATLLIANTIRLSIFSRRREIEVMKLVGATNWFVRGPFMIEGLVCGLIGAVGAVALLILGKEFVLTYLPSGVRGTSDVHALEFAYVTVVLVGGGLVLGAAGSGLTLRRFLKV